MAIGQELLEIPFAELIRNLAFAIAEGQLELDRAAIETLRFLMQSKVPIVTEVAEIIEPAVHTVSVAGQDIPITGVTVRASGAPPVEMTLLQAGLMPTFYQFTEATIEVKLSITMKQSQEPQKSNPGPVALAARVSPIRAFASPVNYRTANTYSYSAQGSSVMRAILKPVPPPPRLTPATVTINTLVSPPTVTRSG